MKPTSVTNNVSHESHDIAIDQSNNGFLFVNIHWASFSTSLSSVLAVIVAMVILAGCCYFRDRRQRQSHARHAKVLRSIVAGATRNVSTHQLTQSGAYPGSPSPDAAQASTTSGGSLAYLVVTYSASPPAASCGLPGCATLYTKSATVSLEPAGRASHLPIGFDLASHSIAIVDRLPTAPPAIEYLPHETAARQTGINSLSG